MTSRAYGGKRRGKTVEELGYDPDAWSTPQWLFDALNAEFNFTLDACASNENAKCSKFISKETNGLDASWVTGGYVFCNPPYSEVEKWLDKAHKEAFYDNVNSVVLVKADTSTRWFRSYYNYASEVRFLPRIQFIPPPGYPGKVGSPNMGHALLIFRGAK